MKRLKIVFITIGWIIIFSSIVLQALYNKPKVELVDIAAIFVASCFVGVMIGDFRLLVGCFLATILGSAGFIFFCLSLPSILGFIYASQAQFYFSMLRLFQGIFILPILGSLIGGFLGVLIKQLFLPPET